MTAHRKCSPLFLPLPLRDSVFILAIVTVTGVAIGLCVRQLPVVLSDKQGYRPTQSDESSDPTTDTSRLLELRDAGMLRMPTDTEGN